MESGQVEYIPQTELRVEHWPAEQPLFILVALASIGIWFLLIFSIFGIFYAVMIGLFLFIAHLTLVTYIRGSAVRLGPDQFPELYHRVRHLAVRAGIEKVPEAYIMQAGGTLNAFATKFLRSNMIVLFSDLLDACGDNTAARDMIVGHELGHIKAGHLRWIWLIVPGMFVPFLGSAYSRAREYTCDRYGAALCGDRQGAALGLAVLAAGGAKGPQVNLAAFVNQSRDLNTGFMTLGKWLSAYPPLCDRAAALEPGLVSDPRPMTEGPLRALGIIAAAALIPVLVMIGFWSILLSSPIFKKAMENARIAQQQQSSTPYPSVNLPSSLPSVDADKGKAKVEKDLRALEALVEEIRLQTGELPPDSDGKLSNAWQSYRPGLAEPLDPFTGRPYNYSIWEDGYVLWSPGPDGLPATEDDINKESALPAEE